MQSGNGIDLAAIYGLLEEVGRAVGDHSRQFALLQGRLDSHEGKLNEVITVVNEQRRQLDQLAAVINDQHRTIDDVASGLRDLRLTVNEYHTAVIGHGISLTSLEDRITRIEKRLGLAPISD